MKDKYESVYRPWIVICSAIGVIHLLWLIFDIPRIVVKGCMLPILPFAIYYWVKFNNIRLSSDRCRREEQEAAMRESEE